MISAKRNIYAFGHKFLVVCPHCQSKAVLVNHGNTNQPYIVLSCVDCKRSQEWKDVESKIRLMGSSRWVDGGSGVKVMLPAPIGYKGARVGLWIESAPDATARSAVFSLDLWLQNPCGTENLWFLNHEHLQFVKTFLQIPRRIRFRSFDTEDSRQQLLWIEPWIKETTTKKLGLSCLKELQLQNPN